jgi:hypothetical protein
MLQRMEPFQGLIPCFPTYQFFSFKIFAYFRPKGRIEQTTKIILSEMNTSFPGRFTFRHAWYRRSYGGSNTAGSTMFSAIH